MCLCVLDGRSTRNTPYCFSSMISRTQTNFDSSIFFFRTDKVAGLVCHSVRNPNFDTSICQFFFLEQTSPNTFPRVNLLGYCLSLFKYLAFFFESIEIYSSHYSSVSSVPFLRIVRLKDCAQETTVLYSTVPAKKCPPAKQPPKSFSHKTSDN